MIPETKSDLHNAPRVVISKTKSRDEIMQFRDKRYALQYLFYCFVKRPKIRPDDLRWRIASLTRTHNVNTHIASELLGPNPRSTQR